MGCRAGGARVLPAAVHWAAAESGAGPCTQRAHGLGTDAGSGRPHQLARRRGGPQAPFQGPRQVRPAPPAVRRLRFRHKSSAWAKAGAPQGHGPVRCDGRGGGAHAVPPAAGAGGGLQLAHPPAPHRDPQASSAEPSPAVAWQGTQPDQGRSREATAAHRCAGASCGGADGAWTTRPVGRAGVPRTCPLLQGFRRQPAAAMRSCRPPAAARQPSLRPPWLPQWQIAATSPRS